MTLQRDATDFIEHLETLHLCLHPTDSLPGIAFDPRRQEALARLISFKGRSPDKSFIGLVATCDKAFEFMAPLPGVWQKVLSRLWPAPLSVVFKASNYCPAALIATDGTVALRVPRLVSRDAWFKKVLETIDFPLPTTSVNTSGNPPLYHWDEAIALVRGHEGIFVPSCCETQTRATPPSGGDIQPSTLIRLREDGNFDLLRRGLVAEHLICDALDSEDFN